MFHKYVYKSIPDDSDKKMKSFHGNPLGIHICTLYVATPLHFKRLENQQIHLHWQQSTTAPTLFNMS